MAKKEFPPWRRARDYRLMDALDRRFLDCRQNGGKALGGHTPPGLKGTIKAEVDRGLTMPGPHRWNSALDGAVQRLVPGVAGWRILSEESSDCDRLPLLRPYLDFAGPLEEPIGDGWFRLLIPVPGFIRLTLTVTKQTGTLPEDHGLELSSLEALLFSQGIDRLLALFREPVPAWDQFRLPSFWQRRGPWFWYQGPLEEYPLLKRFFYDRGILLSPEAEIPSLLPRLWSQGERKLMERISREWQESRQQGEAHD